MDNEIYKKKKIITEKFAEVLAMANSDTMSAEYIYEDEEEVVFIRMKNGAEYKINVNADICMAMLYDICAYMKNK